MDLPHSLRMSPWKNTKTRIKYENIKCEFFFVSQEKNVEATKADQVEKSENVVFSKPLWPDSSSSAQQVNFSTLFDDFIRPNVS